MVMLKIHTGTWVNASRDKRDLSAAMEVGFDVAVMAKGEPRDKMRQTEIDGFRAYLCDTRPLKKLPNSVNRMISALQWGNYIRKFNADVLNCHDLNALQIGWMSTWFVPKCKRPKLVYDAHEFEIGRNTDKKRGKLTAWFVQLTEKFLMKRADLNMMVNDCIADETAKIHGLKEKPLVIRNICNNWKLDQESIAAARRGLLRELKLPEDTFLVMYHGTLKHGRGIEQLIEVAAINDRIALVILGYGTDAYVSTLTQQVQQKQVADRVLFHPAVPHGELWKYVGAADVGMVTVQNVCTSYYYMLPNKFFENVQSLTPVICSNFPEVSKLTNDYGIGLTCDPADIQDINAKIEKMRMDKEFYESCKCNLLKAKEELCWEREKEKLVSAYRQLMEELS